VNCVKQVAPADRMLTEGIEIALRTKKYRVVSGNETAQRTRKKTKKEREEK
jgi:hypothetical protein